ncbi:MAG: urea ABC transporter substrate-binding protein [Fuerstia sp.]|nr:urea ABC transporter substrate-binding protein [Fuerstiella sp.]
MILLSMMSQGSAFEEQPAKAAELPADVSGDAATDTAEASAPIRVGILHSLSGTMAVSEQSLVDAAMMAIEEINARGGVLGRKLLPVIEDGASDWPTFALKAEKLIVEDKVVSVFGCWTSASRKSVLPVVEQHRSLLWYPVQYEGEESSPNIIYTGATPNQQIIPAVDWCRREFGPKMFLVGSDYIFPRKANAIIRLRLADFGATPAGEAHRPLGSQDFDDVVAQIVASKPNVVLNTINGDSNRAFFAALKAAGIDHQIPVMSFSIAEHELRDIGLELTTGHYGSWTYFQSIDTPANRRFIREFRKRYGAERVTDDPIEAAYSQIHMFAKAVEKADSTDVDAIRRAARGLIYAAPGGLIRVDPRNQHTWKVAHIGRIQPDGQFKIVWSSEDPLPPQPWLPATLLAVADETGSTMFTSISAMIDLESAESQDGERKTLFIAMADVRGFLGEARTEFRNAALIVQPGNRLDFEQAWREFERRWEILSGKQDMLTASQRTAFEQFSTAHEAYAKNAASMLEVLYPVEATADTPTASEVVP